MLRRRAFVHQPPTTPQGTGRNVCLRSAYCIPSPALQSTPYYRLEDRRVRPAHSHVEGSGQDADFQLLSDFPAKPSKGGTPRHHGTTVSLRAEAQTPREWALCVLTRVCWARCARQGTCPGAFHSPLASQADCECTHTHVCTCTHRYTGCTCVHIHMNSHMHARTEACTLTCTGTPIALHKGSLRHIQAQASNTPPRARPEL